MNDVKEPYIDTILHSKVDLSPNELNDDLYLSLKRKLMRQNQKRNNRYGFIDNIYKIISYTQGSVNVSNTEHPITFNVEYEAKLYNPQVNDVIVAKINFIIENMINCKNGPIDIYINISSYINKDIFIIDNNGDIVIKKTKEKLKENDNIQVKIVYKEFFKGKDEIRIYGYLYGMV